jgi:hypothetical protein
MEMKKSFLVNKNENLVASLKYKEQKKKNSQSMMMIIMVM